MARKPSLFWKLSTLFAVAVVSCLIVYALPPMAALTPPEETEFNLHSNPKFLACFTNPNDDDPPVAEVEVERGKLNDTLKLELKHFKPGLGLDLFTVQNSNLLSNGTVDPNFKNFGLAWYQSDVEVNAEGEANVKIRTILLDQIFGFDPAVALAPTNTFHVGLWFDDPADAAGCGFDVTKATPFNGQHHAGPNAVISVPDSVTNLGPPCTNPDTSTTPASCHL